MIGVSLEDDNATCLSYYQEHGVDFSALSGAEGGGGDVCDTYGIQAFPTYILIAPDHSIAEQDMWPIDNTQDFITYFENNGLSQSSCNPFAANFTADTTTVCRWDTVYFTDRSTGDITNWVWVFEGGDPDTSTLQNPFTVYNALGVFDVSLTVTNNEGSTETIVLEDYINVDTCNTSTQNLAAENIELYPNPTNGKLDLKMNYSGVKSIEILNHLGKILHKETINISAERIKSFDLSPYSKGLYYIKIHKGNQVLLKKVILY